MSDNVDAFPVLGDPEIAAVKHLPLEVIPKLDKDGHNGFESPSAVMRQQPFDIFKNEMPWCLGLQNPSKVKEESSTGVSESTTAASHREGLAGESADEQIEVGQRTRVDLGNVSIRAVEREVRVVNLQGVSVDFGEPDALVILKGEFEAADARESREVARVAILELRDSDRNERRWTCVFFVVQPSGLGLRPDSNGASSLAHTCRLAYCGLLPSPLFS